MRNKFRLLALVLCAVLCGCQAVGRDPLLKLTFHVVDDEGKAVEGAKAGFGGGGRPKSNGAEGEGARVDGYTDALGVFTGEVRVWDATESGYEVSKQGHYTAWASFSARPAVWGKWQPWNPTIEVVLKRIKNPVPMFAKRVSGEVPAKEKDVGYDLVIGDWITPYGRGKVADLIFHGTGEVIGDRNYRGELTVTFPGQSNGLIPCEVAQPQPSPLRMPYEAPDGGYEPSRVWRAVRKYNPVTMKNEEYINDSSKTLNFFIRVRSEVDAEGRVVKAMYGKIHAPFEFGPSLTTGLPGIYFTYYLNPNYTRNIEYDTKRNLLKPTKRGDSDFQGLAP